MVGSQARFLLCLMDFTTVLGLKKLIGEIEPVSGLEEVGAVKTRLIICLEACVLGRLLIH